MCHEVRDAAFRKKSTLICQMVKNKIGLVDVNMSSRAEAGSDDEARHGAWTRFGALPLLFTFDKRLPASDTYWRHEHYDEASANTTRDKAPFRTSERVSGEAASLL